MLMKENLSQVGFGSTRSGQVTLLETLRTTSEQRKKKIQRYRYKKNAGY